MRKIAHRINSVEQLNHVPIEYGIEVDIRYHENNLIMHHDPFHHHEEPQPEHFADFLKFYKHQGPLILNVKTEGVEKECIALMNSFGIRDWFFLDLSMPFFAIYAEKALTGELLGFGPDNLAVRFSERESLEYALGFVGKAGWVWVDCFTVMPLSEFSYKKLKNNFKICIVSPELQKHSLDRIKEFKEQLSGFKIVRSFNDLNIRVF